MKRTAAVATILVLLFTAGACSSSGSSNDTTTTTAASTEATDEATSDVGGADSAEDAVVGYIEAAALDQWGRVYEGLHPDQQALFSREEFLTCSNDVPFQIEDVEVVETFEEPSPLPGVSDSEPSTAVTIRIETDQGRVQTITAHAFEVDGRWWSSVNEDVVEQCTAE